MRSLLLVLLISSNATGKALVRQRPGTAVTAPRYAPLISDDANTVSHIRWNGVALNDPYGNVWSMQGTVPQVQRSGVVPPGAGPFTSAYYTLGAGSDALDFAGAFMGIVVFSQPSNLASSPVLFTDGTANTNGYTAILQNATTTGLYLGAGGTTASVATVAGVNVMCFGYTGTKRAWKLNLAAFQSANATPVPATSTVAVLGAYNSGGQALGGTIYEVTFTTTPISDAACTAAATAVKTRLGISAW